MAGDHGHGEHVHTGPKNTAYYFNASTVFGRRNVVFASLAGWFVIYKLATFNSGDKKAAK